MFQPIPSTSPGWLARSLIAALAVIAVVAGTLLAPLAAGAAPRKIVCNDAGCHESCTQQLPNGDSVYYDHGTTITVRDGKTGEEIKFKCVDGQWVQQASFQLPQFLKGLKILGNIGVGSLAGLKGEVTEKCNDSPEAVCQPVSYKVAPPGRTISDGGCNPNQVSCF